MSRRTAKPKERREMNYNDLFEVRYGAIIGTARGYDPSYPSNLSQYVSDISNTLIGDDDHVIDYAAAEAYINSEWPRYIETTDWENGDLLELNIPDNVWADHVEDILDEAEKLADYYRNQD